MLRLKQTTIAGMAAFAALCRTCGQQSFAAEPTCFTSADNARLAFEVLQQAPPPRGPSASYAFYPLSGVATMQLGTLETAPAGGLKQYYFQWANRSNTQFLGPSGLVAPRKNNIQPSLAGHRQQRTPFSSIAKADACTLAQTASILKAPRSFVRSFANAGIRLVTEAQVPDQGAVGNVDTCVLASGGLPTAAQGVLLDYEVGDGRTPAQTLDFLRRFTDLVHRNQRRAILLLDPLDAPSQKFTGIDASNANEISRLFDETTVFLWSRNKQGNLLKSYNAQLEELHAGGPIDAKRLIIDFDIEGTSVEDARNVHNVILSDHLAGVMIWRNTAKLGGGCETPENKKLQCLVKGCS